MIKLIELIKDKWPIISSMIIIAGLLFYAYGCEPKTQSLINPNEKVNLAELQLEIDTLMAKSEIRFADLQRQYELKDFIFNQSLIILETGTVNPVGIATAVLAIAGLGAGADDIRLRRQRFNDRKNQQVNET